MPCWALLGPAVDTSLVDRMDTPQLYCKLIQVVKPYIKLPLTCHTDAYNVPYAYIVAVTWLNSDNCNIVLVTFSTVYRLCIH